MACAGRFSDGVLKLVLVLSLDKEAMVLRLNELLGGGEQKGNWDGAK